MLRTLSVVLGILLIFGCADVSKESQLQTGCSGDSESTPENVYVPPAPTPTPTVASWTGVKQLMTSSAEQGQNITSDSSGNVYVTGYTNGGLDGNTNAGSSDLFVVKYNSSGVKQWTKQLGSSAGDYGYSIASDSSGNVYVTGSTGGGLDGNTLVGGEDIFLIKYDNAGNKQWTKQLGTAANDVAQDIHITFDDSIYITGYTEGSLDGNTLVGGRDIFVARYDNAGNRQWIQQFGTTADDQAYGITSPQGYWIYIAGYTEGGLDGSNAGERDIFVAKLDNRLAGGSSLQWTRQLGTSSNDLGNDITSDSSGNVYVTGYTEEGLDGNTSAGGWDFFVVKYNSSGVKQWTKQLGTSSTDYGKGITNDSSGNVYVTGHTRGDLDGNTRNGGLDIFVVKYNSSGVKQWTQQLGTIADEPGRGITSDSSGNVYVTGWTGGSLDGNTSAGGMDLFVVKYDTDGNKQ